MFIDYCCSKFGCRVDRAKFSALVGECDISGKRVLLMKPTTYMNLSGKAVRAATDFYKIPVENVIVISDDTSFDVGKLRIKRKGSDGGQKGLRSIITELGSNNFPRIKMGVGSKPHPDYDMADWVLSDIPKEQRPMFADAVSRGCEALEIMIAGDVELAMNKYN
jgi:PTH1 family peptidyl-tRNA hydrolase